MTTTHHHTAARIAIIIDVYDEPLLTVLIWARQSAFKLTGQLWLGGLLGLWAGPAFAAFDHGHDSLRETIGAAAGALCGFVIGTISAFRIAALRR